MGLREPALCVDCNRSLATFATPERGPMAAVAGAGPMPVSRRRVQRCEACASSRSSTNIMVCALLLAALLSYLWYDILTRQEPVAGTPLVTIYNWLTSHPAPPAPRPPAPAPRMVVEVAPVVVTAHSAPKTEAAPHRRYARFPRPPREMDGLY